MKNSSKNNFFGKNSSQYKKQSNFYSEKTNFLKKNNDKKIHKHLLIKDFLDN